MEIYGYENYIIYENGDVLNVNTGRYLKPELNKQGYNCIKLYKHGKTIHFRIHRLLALAYIPNPENKKEVDHINRNRSDNRLENLRWASRYENSQNKGMFKNNTSGEKNISYYERYKIWRFRKEINKITIYKTFQTKEEAIEFKKQYYEDNNLEYI
tara:strand:+ start:152 stop:619 length:468 start_codon:yes stop_codon:yes gene_type:complete